MPYHFSFIFVTVGASCKTQLDELSAKVATLEAENGSLRKSLEDSHTATSRAKTSLRLKTEEFEEALAEQEKLATKATDAAKLVSEELDAQLRLDKSIDTDIFSKCWICTTFDVSYDDFAV